MYLHGFASGPASIKARYFQEKMAEQGVELIVPDLAEGDFERLTISGQLSVIERAAKGEPVSIIGSSLGGYLAAHYASSHPEVEKLVLMAPAFCIAKRWADALGEKRVEAWKRTGSLALFHYGERAIRRLGYQLVEDAARFPDWPEFTQPALILHGTRDAVVPMSFSEEFASRHPNVRLQVFDSGHELVDVVEPMWREVAPFLGGTGAAPNYASSAPWESTSSRQSDPS